MTMLKRSATNTVFALPLCHAEHQCEPDCRHTEHLPSPTVTPSACVFTNKPIQARVGLLGCMSGGRQGARADTGLANQLLFTPRSQITETIAVAVCASTDLQAWLAVHFALQIVQGGKHTESFQRQVQAGATWRVEGLCLYAVCDQS